MDRASTVGLENVYGPSHIGNLAVEGLAEGKQETYISARNLGIISFRALNNCPTNGFLPSYKFS